MSATTRYFKQCMWQLLFVGTALEGEIRSRLTRGYKESGGTITHNGMRAQRIAAFAGLHSRGHLAPLTLGCLRTQQVDVHAA